MKHLRTLEFKEIETFSKQATHIVTGIRWGGNAVITMRDVNKNNQDKKHVRTCLSAELMKFNEFVSVSAKGEGGLNKGMNFTESKYEINFYGDFLPVSELPNTKEKALEMMRKMPSLVNMANDGKGNQISFKLMPIADIARVLFDRPKIETTLHEINMGFLHGIENIFENFRTWIGKYV